MSGPRDKPPSKAEDDFSDLNVELESEPTARLPALTSKTTGVGSVRQPPETMPAPPDKSQQTSGRAPTSAGSSQGAGPHRPPSRDDARKRGAPQGATSPRPRSEGAVYAQSPSRDKWREGAGTAADDLFTEPTTKKPVPPDAGARDDSDEFGRELSLSDRPTKDAPASKPARPARVPSAPRLPRIPTVDPQAEFAFGFEPDPHAAAGAGASDEGAAAMRDDEPTPARPIDRSAITARSRHALDDAAPRARSPLAADDADLTWGGADGDIAVEIPGPEAPPLPDARDEEGDAYSLVNKASLQPVAMAAPDPRRELNERFALGDYSGALVVAEALIAEGRGDSHVDKVAADCRARLEQMYTARLGALTQVPCVAVPRSELKWLSLDHRAGFLLSLVDGASSIEELIDVSGMTSLEVLRTLYELVGQKVIEFRASASGARK